MMYKLNTYDAILYGLIPMTVRKPSISDLTSIIEKSGGIITERDANLFTVRIRLPGGQITGEQLIGLGKILKKQGVGSLHLTTRQTMELYHINRDGLPAILKALEKAGIRLGAEHDEVVNITACPGTDRCRLANIKTSTLHTALDSAYFGKNMPIRVRIAVSGCPNGCTSERLSEIGITGIRVPIRDDARCTGCGTCSHTCKEHAIVMVNGRLTLDEEKCMECGMCIDSCPFHLICGSPPQYIISIGGRRGRHPELGRELIRVASEEAAIAVVNRTVDWIYRNAYSGKSLTDQLDAMIFANLRERIAAEFGAA